MRLFPISYISLLLFYRGCSASSLCPENFYYYLYDPLIIANTNSTSLNGPLANILRQVHEICCPLNNLTYKRLNSIQLQDDLEVFEKVLTSYSQEILNSMAFTNLKAYSRNTSGMFGPIENNVPIVGNVNGDSVKIITSSGFYLISKPDVKGFPLIRSKLIDILLKTWPLFIIILLVYGYSSIFIWLMDNILKLNLFPSPFIQGFVYGLWWLSCIVFTPNSLIARTTAKTWIVRCFISVWMLVSILFLVIFISVFTTALTVYANHGHSLENKIIGVNRYSSDKNWLRLENSDVKEYEKMNELFFDLENLKLDYILVDEMYAKFYARTIENKFHVARNIKRKLAFEVVLRGFNKENLNCFHEISTIIAQNWFKNSINYNSFRIKKDFQYFDVTDEFLKPQINVWLFLGIGLLVVLIVAGVVWQFWCMKKSENFYSYALKSGGFNTFFKDDMTLKKGDEKSMNFYDRALIKARDEVMLRQQSRYSYKSDLASSKPSIHLRHSFASDKSNNYFQVPIAETQQNQLNQTQSSQEQIKKHTPKRIRSLKERSLEFFHNTGSCSFKRNKTKTISINNITDSQTNVRGVSLKKKSSSYYNNNNRKELSCQIKCIFGSASGSSTTEDSYSKVKNFLTDSSLQNIEPLKSSGDSYYLGEYLSVKL